jgi:DNA-binding PadR family transcriptional regulator
MMEDRLKRLRNVMDEGAFKAMPFTEEKKQMLKRGIESSQEKKEDLLVHILQLLLKEKTGHELLKHLRARGIKKYEERQGFLYSTLHKMEQDRLLESSWVNGAKVYKISNQGKKLLQQVEDGKQSRKHYVKALLEGK